MFEERAFDAVIADGRIQHEANLNDWEGEKVQVTLTVGSHHEEVTGDLDVEKDVYVKMTVCSRTLKNTQVRDLGKAKPSVILPQGIEND